jgi:hypothetical protein
LRELGRLSKLELGFWRRARRGDDRWWQWDECRGSFSGAEPGSAGASAGSGAASNGGGSAPISDGRADAPPDTGSTTSCNAPVADPYSASIAGTWSFTPAGGALTKIQVPGGGWIKQGFAPASATYQTEITIPNFGAPQTTFAGSPWSLGRATS